MRSAWSGHCSTTSSATNSSAARASRTPSCAASTRERDDPGRRLTLEQARANRLRLEWRTDSPTPTFLGSRSFRDIPLDELRTYIDWTPFFDAWEVPGRYPDILTDEKRGPAASALFDDAQRLLDRIVNERLLTSNAVVGFWPANSTDDDDIVLFTDEFALSRARSAARASAADGQAG